MSTAPSSEVVTSSGNLANRSCVLKAAMDLHLKSETLHAPGPNELQVAVRSTGLCGSDLHYYRHFRNGDIIVREPMALGHESAGTITAVGADVTGFEVGDNVALEVGLPCGTLQDRVIHPAAWCHKLPKGVSLDLGALLEPLSVALHAARRSGSLKGTTVCVLGAGAVGALAAAVARIEGCRAVVITDIDQGRVKFAVENKFADAGFIIRPSENTSLDQELSAAQETAQDISRVTLPNGDAIGEIDVIFECTGVTSSVRTGIYASRAGGKLMLIGMGTPMHLLPLSAAALREVDILGVFRYANTYPDAIKIISNLGPSTPDIEKLVTHRVEGLENAEKAFELAMRSTDDEGNIVMKVVLENNQAWRDSRTI